MKRSRTSLALALALFGLAPLGLAQDDPTQPEQPEQPAAPEAPEQAPQAPQPAPPPPAPEPPPAPTKASLAVLPFTFSRDVLRRTADGELRLVREQFETTAFTNKLITALVQTRKFDVVERQRVDELLNEMQMAESGLMSNARAVRAGQMIGCDYILMGEISVFTSRVEWKPIPNTSRHTRTITINIIVDMRIVDSRTSKVVAANKGELEHVERSMHDRIVATQLDPKFMDDVQRELCQQLVLHTIDGVYPIRIVGLNEGTITLNRGEGGGLEVGQRLDVYLEGAEVTDPDTGDSLGFEEVKVGTIEVTEILPRFSKALVVNQRNPLSKGAICRPAKAPVAVPTPAPSRGPRW